jgi:hypothetical protein
VHLLVSLTNMSLLARIFAKFFCKKKATKKIRKEDIVVLRDQEGAREASTLSSLGQSDGPEGPTSDAAPLLDLDDDPTALPSPPEHNYFDDWGSDEVRPCNPRSSVILELEEPLEEVTEPQRKPVSSGQPARK